MERPHPCGRFACILHALSCLSPRCTTKRPVLRSLTQTRLHRIILDVLNYTSEMPGISNVTIEVFFLPEATLTLQHPVSFI